MKLFDKPKWLKPEINEPLYWLHLAIIAAVVLGSMHFFGQNLLTIRNVLISIPLLAVGDVVAHTLLGLD